MAGATGCSGAPDAAPQPAPSATATEAPSPLPDGVTVEIVQLRADVAPRQAQVRIANDTDEPITVGAVRVEDPRFTGPVERVLAGRTSTVPPGARVDVRVQLPPVACRGGASPAAESLAVIALEGDDEGSETTVESVSEFEAVAADPLGFLAPLYERECRAVALASAVGVEFTEFEPSPAGEPASLTLAITPAGGGATIVGVQRTNLLDFGAATRDGAYPVDLDVAEGDAPTTIDIPLVPFRCDPHAVQEDKRGTIFDVRIVLDGEPGEIELFVGEEMRGRILTWVAEWCGFGA